MVINKAILKDVAVGSLHNGQTPQSKNPPPIGPDSRTSSLDNDLNGMSLSLSLNAPEGSVEAGWEISDSSTADAGTDFAVASMQKHPAATLFAQGNHQAQSVFQLLQ